MERTKGYSSQPPRGYRLGSCRLAANRIKLGFKRLYAKFVSGWIGNNHKLNQYSGVSALCPICNNSIEKSSHILQCRYRNAKDKFFESMEKNIGEAYKKQKTYAPIQLEDDHFLNNPSEQPFQDARILKRELNTDYNAMIEVPLPPQNLIIPKYRV